MPQCAALVAHPLKHNMQNYEPDLVITRAQARMQQTDSLRHVKPIT